jgi:hypothetical protein
LLSELDGLLWEPERRCIWTPYKEMNV